MDFFKKTFKLSIYAGRIPILMLGPRQPSGRIGCRLRANVGITPMPMLIPGLKQKSNILFF